MKTNDLTEKEIELKQKLWNLAPWMYKFQFTEKIFSPIVLDELSEIHDTGKKIIFSKLDKIYENKWNELDCLDIGCNEGYFSFELCKRGVKKVTGFDARPINIEKANLVKNYFDYKNSEFFVNDINLIESEKLGKYDLVLFLGLLYHIENPMLILRKVRDLTRKLCVIDTQITRFNDKITMGWGIKENDKETFDSIALVEEKTFENSITGSITGLSFVPNKSSLLKMLKYAGFQQVEILDFQQDSHEQYVNSDRIIVLAH